jgi:hypothetical protein
MSEELSVFALIAAILIYSVVGQFSEKTKNASPTVLDTCILRDSVACRAVYNRY